MKVLAAGDFQQGTPAGADALTFEMPQHKVTIAHAFAAGVYDVTVGEYSEFVAATGVGANSCTTYDGAWRVNPSVTWRNAIESQTASHPVEPRYGALVPKPPGPYPGMPVREPTHLAMVPPPPYGMPPPYWRPPYPPYPPN